MTANPRPIDFRDAFYAYAPGVLLTRELDDALGAQFMLNGGAALSQSQVLAIVGPLPAFPTSVPRLADSNPDPHTGWALDNQAAFS